MRTVALAFVLCTIACSVRAAQVTEVAIANPGFEMPPGKDNPVPGWVLTQHVGDKAYEVALDTKMRAEGKRSVRITRLREQVYASVSQHVEIAPSAADRTIELRAQMRTRGATQGGWKLMMTVFGPNGQVQQLRSDPMLGNKGFAPVKLIMKVPAGTSAVDIGGLLLGGGSAWLDDVHLRILE